ncbi:MAG: DNA repair protein RadC [Acidobacteria bacterium]|nr:DNA repair protein RadC [Acidobacteriota bacterium]
MNMRIRDIEPSQRPRERLLAHGPRVLSDAELLAVLLRTGRRGQSAIDVARQMLQEEGGLAGLARAGARSLAARPGLGPAKAATLAAALELAHRLASAELTRRERLDRPEAVGGYLVQHLAHHRREVFGFVSLDGRHGLIRVHDLSNGTRRTAPVDTGELFREAVLDGASGMVLYHNHPSGTLDPSRDDLELTKRLVAGGALIGVDVLDHLIVAGARWLSLRTTHPGVFGRVVE